MGGALRAPDRRTLAVLGSGLLGAACFGLLAGRWPMVAVGAVVAVALAAVMFKDLAVGIAVFTVVSYAGVLSSGSASAAKGVGALLVLAWIAALAKRSGRDVRSLLSEHRPLVACALALLIWSVLSAAWAQSPGTALSGASRWAQDLILFPILYTGLRRLTHVRWVLIAFVGGALLAMLYGAATGSTVDGSRLVGALGDPNETATVLLVASVLALALGIGESRSRVRRWIAFVAAVVALFGMVATASRGGIVALAGAALVAIVLAGRWRRQIALAAVVGAVVVTGWVVLLAPAGARSHITSAQTPRTTLWTVAERAIAANPVVGVGTNNFAIAAKHYLLEPGATTRADQIVTTPHVAHSIYLEVWADTGAIGLLLFLGVVLAPLRAAWTAVAILENAGQRAAEILARALIVATVAILTAGFFISDEYSKQLFLLLALAPAMLAAVRTEFSESGRRIVTGKQPPT